MEEIKLFSLIIPAYKEQNAIVGSVKSVEKVLRQLSCSFEIIIVVDGIVDGTLKKLSTIKSSHVRVLSYEKNQGKGYAVKFGVNSAIGDVVGFIDAGMDIDPRAIPLLLEYMKLNNADIVLGSKLHPDSKIKYPLPRRVLSWGYRKVSHSLFGFNVKDTQVGLKLFRKEVAHKIFERTMVKGFAFDIEVLALAYVLGYKNIIEAPIKLRFNNISSITTRNFWKISIDTLYDTLGVFYRLKITKRYDKINAINDTLEESVVI